MTRSITLTFLFTVLSLLPTTSLFAQGQTCAEATAVSGGVVYTIDTVWGGFGNQYGCFQPGPEHALWYVYTAPFTGEVEVTSCSEVTTTDTRVSIYTGSCGALQCHAWNDDGNCPWVPTWLSSRVTFDVVQGQQYFIQWDKSWTNNQLQQQWQWIINTCEVRVEGTIFRDLNGNEVRDEGEPLYNALLARNGQQELTYTSSDPYLLCSPIGEHTITIVNPPVHFNVVPPERTFITNQVNSHFTGMDFALQPIPGVYDGSVSLWGNPPWIGNNTIIEIRYINIGTEPITASLVFHLDPMLEYVGSTIPHSSLVNNTVTWDLGTLEVAQEGVIPVQIFTPITADWGAETTSWVLLNVVENDVDGTNNIDEFKVAIVAAYDPNDKQVDAETISPDDVEDRIKLKYTIRFQNTGDAPAVNVIIRDTLDDNVDISTFEMIGATHNYQLSLNGRELVWTFPNIMLPDSTTDFDASIGAFHYRIAVNEDLLLGDQVANTAHIFFDYADPIVTNTVVTTVSMPTSIGNADAHRSSILLHPSPTTGPFNIRWLGEAAVNMHIDFTDAIGRTIFQRSLPALHHAQDLSFDLSAVPAGSYFVRIHGAQVDVRTRLVIQR